MAVIYTEADIEQTVQYIGLSQISAAHSQPEEVGPARVVIVEEKKWCFQISLCNGTQSNRRSNHYRILQDLDRISPWM